MFNSTIKRKKCKCSPTCTKYPTSGYEGYFYDHAPEEIKERVGSKRQVAIKRTNSRRYAASKLRIIKTEIDNELELWFIARRLELELFCDCGCGQKTERQNDKTYKNSIAHVLAKSKFKSIATHPENFLSLAFYGGCHTTLDSMGYENCKNTKPVLWAKIVAKFKILYPFISPVEHKHIPQLLLDTLN